MASTAQHVTIDRAYFETLLRKAQKASNKGANPLLVTVSKVEYDELRKKVREYGHLKNALYRGGITDATINVLLAQGEAEDANTLKEASPQKSSESGTQTLTDYTETTEDFYSQEAGLNATSSYVNTPRATSASLAFGTPSASSGYDGYDGKRGQSNSHSNHQNNGNYYNDYGYDQDQPNGYYDPHDRQGHGLYQDENAYVEEYEQPRKPRKISRRTVQLGNLDKMTSLGDVTAVVCGGPLLDVFLRTHDRICSVSFINDEDANAFYQYAKKNDLYIRGKRVQVFWAERHFTLPNHVANKINIGATRNILIHNAASRHTEASIRDDLEHIHNCMVISVKFVGPNGQDAKIETNAIHNAMFARTCMMSRAKYKGSKIDWASDDCAVPCPERKPSVSMMPIKKKEEDVPANRFQVLSLDSEYDTESGLAKGKMRSSAVEIR